MPADSATQGRLAYDGRGALRVVPDLPLWRDLLAGGERRAAFLNYWRGMTVDDWRDLIAVSVLRRLPVAWSSGFGAASASIRGPKVYAEADALARTNLARLRPDLSEAEREAMLTARWRCVGRTMAEFSVLDRMMNSGRVAVVGAHHLDALKASGRGGVMISAHLGNWEALTMVTRLGLPLAIVYEPRPTRAREYISQKARRRLGVDPLPPGVAGVRPAIRALESGGMVSFFCDEEIDGVARGPFLGRKPYLHGNLAYAVRLAARTGAAVVPAFVRRTGATRLTVTFLEPIDIPPQTTAKQAAAGVTKVNAALEAVVLANLDQWFNLHERLDEVA
jgi:KDO2-lipid IV(A) lauroyltransferase